LLQNFVFLELSVANSHDLRVQNHLVHVLDIVNLFVDLVLRLGKNSLLLLFVFSLKYSWLQFCLPFLIHVDHASLASLSLYQLLFFLLVLNFSGEHRLFLCLNFG
jgi:hypothetical protein